MREARNTRRGVCRAALALLAGAGLPAALAADETTTIHLTVASSHTTGLPWVGVMHTLVVPESNKRLAASTLPDASGRRA